MQQLSVDSLASNVDNNHALTDSFRILVTDFAHFSDMKKIRLFTVCFILYTSTFAQTKESLSAEMERLNRLGDSLHKVRLARDSAFQEEMNESLRKLNRDIATAKSIEIEKATEQVLVQHRKEQKRKRMAALLTIAAFGVAVLAGAFIAKRRKENRTH